MNNERHLVRRGWWIFPALLVTICLAPGFAAADVVELEAESRSGESSASANEKGTPDEHTEHGDETEHSEGHENDHGGGHGGKGHSSRLSDEVIELRPENVPQRPKPILELGEPYLGTGTISPGIQLPTGAVWQPSLIGFGTFRTAIQSFESDLSPDARITEWSNRLDLFFNLQLSGTERLVVGFRALDQDGRFTSYYFEHPNDALDGSFQDELNAEIQTLFFEGDFGEIFPNLDRDDFASHDVGFSVGRQPLRFQEGLLINDSIDGVGFTRNTLQPGNSSNFRSTFFYGWDNLDAGGVERSGNLFALLTSTDLRYSTVDVDAAYLQGHGQTGDLFGVGISAVQRIGKTSSSFRVLGSFADEETAFSSDGVVVFSELSWVPHYTDDHVYFNAFAAFDEFVSVARDPSVGGPLGRAGINFAAVGLGSYGAPLSSRAKDVVGGAIGYQKFLDHNRKQLIVEAGFRGGIASDVGDQAALTVRFQSALGRHSLIVVDGFVSHRDRQVTSHTPFGGRLELQVKF